MLRTYSLYHYLPLVGYNDNRMTNDDWTIRVLEKLRKFINDGYMKQFVGWGYDNESSKEDENRALLRLETNKVITVWTDESGSFFPDKQGVLVTGEDNFGAYDMTTGNLNRDAIVGNFNASAYERACSTAGIDAYSESYKASLQFEGFGTTPVVLVGNDKYRFSPLQEDKNKHRLFKAISKHAEKLISIKNVRTIKGLEEVSNLNKLLENSVFASGSPLAPFITLTKDSIVFHADKLLTPSQLSAIKQHSKTI